MIDRQTLNDWIDEATTIAEEKAGLEILNFKRLHRLDSSGDYIKAVSEFKSRQLEVIRKSLFFLPDNLEESINNMLLLIPEYFDRRSKVFQSSAVEIRADMQSPHDWIVNSIAPTIRAYKLFKWVDQKEKSKSKDDNEDLTLEDVVNPSRLNELKEKYRDYVKPGTVSWIGSLGELAALLRDLYLYHYLKDDIKQLSGKQRIAIAKNTFNVDLKHMVNKYSHSPLEPKREKFR